MPRQMLLFLTVMVLLTACKKQCESYATRPECADTPPTNEMCAAAFSRWFYNPQTNACTLVDYSGCSQKGFATLADCQPCIKGKSACP